MLPSERGSDKTRTFEADEANQQKWVNVTY